MMRLSEAIRLGATLRPQGFQQYLTAFGRTCALGAALEALGMEPHIEQVTDLVEMYPFLLAPPAVAPPYATNMALCLWVILELNDVHRLTREQIADWLATFEPEPEPDEVPVLAEPVAA